MYNANLRLPPGIGKAEKEECCRSIVASMGLSGKLNQAVGGPLPGGTNLRGKTCIHLWYDSISVTEPLTGICLPVCFQLWTRLPMISNMTISCLVSNR